MIYATEARACEIADMLNQRRGFPKAYAYLTVHGWTVGLLPYPSYRPSDRID